MLASIIAKNHSAIPNFVFWQNTVDGIITIGPAAKGQVDVFLNNKFNNKVILNLGEAGGIKFNNKLEKITDNYFVNLGSLTLGEECTLYIAEGAKVLVGGEVLSA